MRKRCKKIPQHFKQLTEPVVLQCVNPNKNERKEYQVGVFLDTSKADDNNVMVVTAWGRIGAALQCKIGKCYSVRVSGIAHAAALGFVVAEANDAISGKEKRGYTGTSHLNKRFTVQALKEAINADGIGTNTIWRVPEKALQRVIF